MSDSHPKIQINSALEQVERAQAALEPLTGDISHLHRLATMGTLTAGVAHEINNLLTPILAYAQLALEHPEDRVLVVKSLEKAVAGIETASRIAENILGFTSATPQESNGADIEESVIAALECLARQPEKRGIRIEKNIDHHLLADISPTALQHVMLNLFINACDALGSKGGTLSISALRQPDGRIEVSIADTGPGIDPDLAGRIFEPFVTSGASRETLRVEPDQAARQQGGSGLGLAICKHLIETAGGSIEASSIPSEGAVFTLHLQPHEERRAKAG